MRFKEYIYLCKKIERKAIFEILLILSICLFLNLIFYNLPINKLTKQLLLLITLIIVNMVYKIEKN